MKVDDDVAELAQLRRRAYGPGADIGADPAALARLDELETRIRLRFASPERTSAGPATPDTHFPTSAPAS